jgi:hypothetical protein
VLFRLLFFGCSQQLFHHSTTPGETHPLILDTELGAEAAPTRKDTDVQSDPKIHPTEHMSCSLHPIAAPQTGVGVVKW